MRASLRCEKPKTTDALLARLSPKATVMGSAYEAALREIVGPAPGEEQDANAHPECNCPTCNWLRSKVEPIDTMGVTTSDGCW